jgi:hypothetical protein
MRSVFFLAWAIHFTLSGCTTWTFTPIPPEQVHDPRGLIARFDRDPQASVRVVRQRASQAVGRRWHDRALHAPPLSILDADVR